MISIIIPTLNEEGEIERTLQYLKECKENCEIDIEIIVSDGGSTDKTTLIAKKYADHVVVYEGKERQTISGGKNLGASRATGEHLLFIDADVRIPEAHTTIVKIVEEIERDETHLGATAFLMVRPEDATLTDKIIFGFMNYFSVFVNNVLNSGGAPGEFMMIRHKTFKELGGFREDLPVGEDWDLFRRMVKIGKARTYSGVTIFHSGRRAHKIGWPKLLWQWFINNVYVILFDKSAHKEWTPHR